MTYFNPADIARDFPQLARTVEGRRLVYLDSAATSLKPQAVIDAVCEFYRTSCGNVHRGDHLLSQEASARIEEVRYAVARLVNATSREIVFTSGTTAGLNLVADGLRLEAGDNVVTTLLDHHSNILPWMSRCEVRFLPLDPDGRMQLDALPKLIDARTKLVTLGHVSNVTGVIQPVREAIAIARARNVPTAIDAAQSVPHLAVDVMELGCDFLAFSGHKMLGPSGTGVLFVSDNIEDRMQPRYLGGGAPDHVRADGYKLKDVPHRLESGTPNIEGIFGLGAAIEYLQSVGYARIAEHDRELCAAMHRMFDQVPGVRMLGPASPSGKIAIASLVPVSERITVKTLGRVLSDSFGVMARSGTHCAHPFFAQYKGAGSLRLSPYIYNTTADLEVAARALTELLRGDEARS